MSSNANDMDLVIENGDAKGSAEAKHLHFDRGTTAYEMCGAYGTGKGQLTSKMINALGKRLKGEGFSNALARATKAGGGAVCLVTWNPETGEWDGLPEKPEAPEESDDETTA